MHTLLKTSMAVLIASTALSSSAFAQDLKFTMDDTRFSWESLDAFKAMDLSGETIDVFGPWQDTDKDLVESVFDFFENATGATVNYAGSGSFEQQIVIDLEAGSPPHIAIFPQPGLAGDLAARGHLVPLGDETKAWTIENYSAGQSWVDLGTYSNGDGGTDFYGFFYKVDVKSLVWYSPDNFEDAGYEIPATMEDLEALQDQIVADGGTPWCIGLGSGGATGWPATDWVEDFMLRTQAPDVYDKWVSNEIPFNDPRVVAAIEAFGAIAKNDSYVSGGAAAVATTDFGDSPKGLFDVPAKCFMHKQASFIPSFFPEGTELGTDADFFYFPAYASKDLGKPVLGAGTLFSIAKESKGARALMDFLKTPIANEVWMAQSSFLTPLKGVNLDAYANDSLRKQGEILLNATTFRFDGSDLMPGAVGAGSFWTGMVDYTSGSDAQSVADAIQKSWDAVK